MKMLITGASSGIGEACALRFAKLANQMVLLARREEKLKLLKTKLQAIAPELEVEIQVVDVQDKISVMKLQKESQIFQAVDLLLNNAGLALGNAPLHLGKVEDWDQMINTNINGLLYITKCVLPQMVERKKGHIINMGSVAGRWVYPGGNVYNATKFAVRALSEGMRQDISGSNVRITNIEPGMVETEFSEVRFQDAEKASKVYAGMNPLKAEDIAETVEWCFNRPAHVNVQELVIFPTDQAAIQMVHRV